ncbi:ENDORIBONUCLEASE LACTB2 [Salix koriyanagi]|uniref:ENDORIBONUCLEASE LACTB2 n=1 Tax=Salix koriyanagi TaxID=2511006 RepID=A0A9Q0WRC0_9ROSI|nr:ENDORIBONUCLEASE LACTB2 [Salix koriyanagi]
MATYNLALILGNPSNDAEFLLAKQTPPPKLGIEEYDSFVDSDLWDLPSKKLELVEGEWEPGSFVIEGIERTTLRKFDFDSAINKVICKLNSVFWSKWGLRQNDGGEWRFLKHLEEAGFGPGLPVHTVYISGKLLNRNQNLPELCKWMSIQSCLSWLVDVKPSSDRVGPLVVLGLINDSVHSSGKVDTALDYQEYPPGVIIVPMRSRTTKPFHTTNLVVFAPESVKNKCEDYNFVAHGDALIVDPGCRANFHKELLKVVAPLSKKLVVFVTHHHRDHIDGLSVIQKCNPNATLLAHKNSMRRIGKGDWSLNHISVSGGEDICIGGQRLNIIFAPGHTDGHLALLHVDTHSLIVGDHCVGQGSALLDITSGGNMTDYFQSTYKFIDLAPHVLIPMHGRVNLWPKRMLCGYLKNRRSRELSILEAIENGAKDIN